MNIPTLQALMIDLDGTMVDTMADFEAALNLALADIDLPKVDKSVVNIAVGKGSEHLVRTVLQHQLRLPEVQASGLVCDNTTVDSMYEAAFLRYQHHYGHVNGQHAEVYAGVLQGLQAFQAKGLPMACLTNKPTAFAKDLLARKGLDGFFGHVYGGDAFPRKARPHAAVGNLQSLGHRALTHLDAGRLAKRRPSRAGRGLSGGVGDLWLQPWRAHSWRGLRRLHRQLYRTQALSALRRICYTF